jgi:hypothetical protein
MRSNIQWKQMTTKSYSSAAAAAAAAEGKTRGK